VDAPELEPLDPLDPFAPEHRANPYPVYRRLRDTDPIHWSESQGAFLLTRYADCIDVLRAPGASVSPENEAPGRHKDQAPDPLRNALETQPMLFLDPPDHTRLRGLVSKAFTPRTVEAMRPHIVDLVDGLLDDLSDKGELDVVEDLAFPLPVIVIAEMLGVPLEDRDQLKPWSREMARTIDPVISEETMQSAAMSAMQFANYLNELIDDRRRHPGDDLLSALIAAEEEGEKLSHEELVVNTILLFIAGHETTQNLIGNGLLALLRNPDQLDRLRQADGDAAAAKNAVEEMLRYDGPVQLTGRHLTADVQLSTDGTTLAAGTTAITLVSAADRDPAMFDHPDRFEIARPNANRHIGFGQGVHFCLGAPLARVEAQVAIPAMLRRFAKLELMVDEPEYRENFTLRGLATLPVRVTL
jgi:cytochrome P450